MRSRYSRLQSMIISQSLHLRVSMIYQEQSIQLIFHIHQICLQPEEEMESSDYLMFRKILYSDQDYAFSIVRRV